MTPHPEQLELDFLLGLYRMLLRPAECAVILHDCSEQHILNLAEEGKLRSFDLYGSGTAKRLLRIPRYCIEHLAISPKTPIKHLPIAMLLPVERPTLHRQEIARWFGVAENTVREWPISGPRCDKRSIYHRDSVISFLESREIK